MSENSALWLQRKEKRLAAGLSARNRNYNNRQGVSALDVAAPAAAAAGAAAGGGSAQAPTGGFPSEAVLARNPKACRHFFSEKGCHRADKCRFVHVLV